MAEPSKSRNFFGRVVDRILPGSNYDASSGRYSNVGVGLAGLGARLAATAFAGPAVGALVGKGASMLIDRNGNRIGDVQREGLPVDPGAVSASGYPGAVAMPSVSNLGFGAQTPGGSWNGYTQGQGSVNNFGNQQFGTGMASQPGSWSPYSQWGQQVTAQPAAPGSVAGFGNNTQQFAGGGGGSSSGGSMGGNRMAGIVGGRLANDSMLDVQRRWASK